MRTDDKWIDVETVEQSGASWWTANDTKAQLGIVKSAGVNIVLFRERGGRQCGDHMHSGFEWIKNNSQVISNTVGKLKRLAAPLEARERTPVSGMLLKTLDEELSKANRYPWRASDGGCFRAMLAIRCAYKFVWLELAWKYYAATSDAPHKVDIYTDSFDARCTRVVFIQ
ncbi:hypothetical protein AAVH_31282 [Aphelenchoides avenae]|nr:hypothetical protein AAVH_31282 [Aphelenchus avenae]